MSDKKPHRPIHFNTAAGHETPQHYFERPPTREPGNWLNYLGGFLGAYKPSEWKEALEKLIKKPEPKRVRTGDPAKRKRLRLIARASRQRNRQPAQRRNRHKRRQMKARAAR